MARRTGGGESAIRPYGPLAEAYDIVHARKPYAREARVVRALAQREGRRPLRTLLDVACGSGRHLEQFARWFDCTGLDASPGMLARARRRVPTARLVRGRMEAFDLRGEFDVVTCLFSAIGYVRSTEELRRTIRNLARHTVPGGVVVVEPWLTPRVFRKGHISHLVRTSGRTTVVRMDGSRRRGSRSIFDFHYLVGRNGRVVHRLEVHDLGLFDRPTVRAAFRAAGLEVRYVRGGFPSGRGLWVGRRPVRPAAAGAGRPTSARSRPRAPR